MVSVVKFNWESTNLPEQWGKFKSYVELMLDGPIKKKFEEVISNSQLPVALAWIGDKGREIRDT